MTEPTMTPERWQQIRDLLEQALEVTPEQRSVLLNRACTADSALRHEVETLLASSAARSNFLASPPPRVALSLGANDWMVIGPEPHPRQSTSSSTCEARHLNATQTVSNRSSCWQVNERKRDFSPAMGSRRRKLQK